MPPSRSNPSGLLIADGEKASERADVRHSRHRWSFNTSAAGNRTGYEDVSFAKREQLFALVLAESLEQQGRFLPDIVMTYLVYLRGNRTGAFPHIYMQKAGGVGLPDVQEPSVDIFAGRSVNGAGAWQIICWEEKLDSISHALAQTRIYYLKSTGVSLRRWRKPAQAAGTCKRYQSRAR